MSAKHFGGSVAKKLLAGLVEGQDARGFVDDNDPLRGGIEDTR
jgi:hypothetical protein